MSPEAPDLPPEPSVEATREALRRRAQQARMRSIRLREAYRATVREGVARRERDHAVEHAIACAAHGGDVAARDALMWRYTPLVTAMAHRCSDGSSARPAELLNAGFASLMESIDGWDPAVGGAFRDYAVERTRAAIQTAAA